MKDDVQPGVASMKLSTRRPAAITSPSLARQACEQYKPDAPAKGKLALAARPSLSTLSLSRTEWVLMLVLGAALVACSRAEAGGVVGAPSPLPLSPAAGERGWGEGGGETAEWRADGESPRHLASLAMPVLGDQWSWHRVSQAVDYVLSDQKRVLQLTVIGTCVALYLMFRTRW